MKRSKKKKTSKVYFEKIKQQVFESISFDGSFKSLTQKLSSLFFLIFIFLLPTQLGKHFFPSFSYLNGVRVDYLSPTVYVIDVVVFLLLIFNFKSVIEFCKNKKVLLSLGVLLINVIFANNQLVALYKLVRIIEFLVVFVLGRQMFSFIKEKNLITALFLTGGLQLGISVLQMIYKHSLQGVFYLFGERLMSLSTPGIAKASLGGIELLRPYGTFSHPNSLAGFFLLLYFFVLLDKNFDKYTILKYLNLLVFTILIFISFSKIAILTYLILNTLYWVLNTKLKCIFCKIARILIPVFVSLVFLFAITDPLTVDKRLELIKSAFSIIKESPIFGVGLGNYLIVQSKSASIFPLFFNQPVHNIFLLFITEAGFFVSAVIFKIFLSLKLKKEGLIITFAVIITGFFDHYWLTLQQNWLLLAFVYGAASSSFLIAKLRSSN